MGHMDGHFEPLDDCLSPLAYLLRLPDSDGIHSDSLWWCWWCCGSGGSGIIEVVLVLLLAMVVVILVVVLL